MNKKAIVSEYSILWWGGIIFLTILFASFLLFLGQSFAQEQSVKEDVYWEAGFMVLGVVAGLMDDGTSFGSYLEQDDVSLERVQTYIDQMYERITEHNPDAEYGVFVISPQMEYAYAGNMYVPHSLTDGKSDILLPLTQSRLSNVLFLGGDESPQLLQRGLQQYDSARNHLAWQTLPSGYVIGVVG